MQTIGLYLLTRDKNIYIISLIILNATLNGRSGEPKPGVFGSFEPEPQRSYS